MPKINICQTHVSFLVAIYTSKGGLLSTVFLGQYIKENTIIDSTFTKSEQIIMEKIQDKGCMIFLKDLVCSKSSGYVFNARWRSNNYT